MNPIWSHGLTALLGTAAAGLIAYFAFGPDGALVVVALAAIALGARHLWRMHILRRWAVGAIDAPVPDAPGAWGWVFQGLYRRTRTRVEQQRVLQVALDRFRTAAEALPDGMVILDAHNCVVWSNPRAQQHLGIRPGKDQGQPLANIVRQPEFVRYLELRDFSEPVVFGSSRQQAMILSVQIVPYGTEQRLLMSRDITRIEEAARMRRDFIANVSHELKTPLTVLSGFLETMSELRLDREQSRRYVRLMQEQAGSMRSLVEDLLALSALESDDHELREESVDVPALVQRAQVEAEALSGGKHDIHADLATRLRLRGNRDEIASALGNLVSNAIRYTPPSGTITIGWREENGEGLLSVSDTGIGVAEEHIPRLTERFYRVDRSRSRATGGTGLGLAIVKHVLLRHQAQLDVTSTLGRGSTFTLRFPGHRMLPAEADSAQTTRAAA